MEGLVFTRRLSRRFAFFSFFFVRFHSSDASAHHCFGYVIRLGMDQKQTALKLTAAPVPELELWLCVGSEARSHIESAASASAAASTATVTTVVSSPPPSPAARTALQIVNGQYPIVIDSALGRAIAAPLIAAATASKPIDSKQVYESLVSAVATASSTSELVEVLLFGVACLNQFTASNYTGPFDVPAVPPLLESRDKPTLDTVNGLAVSALKLNGEDIFSRARHMYLLLIARAVLLHARISKLVSAPLWAVRYCMVHQTLLVCIFVLFLFCCVRECVVGENDEQPKNLVN